MDTTEFLQMAYSLACTIGPAAGLVLAGAVLFYRRIKRRGFAIVIGGRRKEKPSQRPLPAQRKRLPTTYKAGAVIAYEPERKKRHDAR